jgi:AcrR family transcriptional regulator
MNLRETKRVQVHARILEVCETLFRKHGFEATSVDDIAAAAEISRQTFFNYFPAKDAVLTELAIAWLQRQAALPRLDATRPPKVSVLAEARRVVAAQARAIEKDRAFMTLIVLHATPFSPADNASADNARTRKADVGRGIFRAVADVIRLGQSAGEIRPEIDPLRIAEVYVSAMLMSVRLWLLGDGRKQESLETRLKLTIDILEGGMRAHPARKVR